jgi:hypothetical protein
MNAPGLASQLTARKRPLPVTALVAWQASLASGMPSPSLSGEVGVQLVAPGGLVLPTGQLKQTVLPLTSLNVPTGHKRADVAPELNT